MKRGDCLRSVKGEAVDSGHRRANAMDLAYASQCRYPLIGTVRGGRTQCPLTWVSCIEGR